MLIDPKYAPQELSKLIVDLFSDEKIPANTQIATIGENGLPQVRTVQIRYLKGEKTLGINTHRDSGKGRALRKTPILAGCYYAAHQEVQLRFEAKVVVVEGDSPLLDEMWNVTNPTLRKVYWDKKERHPSFVTLLCHPYLWDVYFLNGTDFSQSTRTIYRFDGVKWSSQHVSTLTGKPLREVN